ncbi:MAG: PhoH family protein [Candidatus Omnitrophota bacterium]|jgi:phosphate starvation-inducible PhoH-like protein|nr:MAG: PhoH family protein [Candidatus Omnitrophota bacterium]
MQQVSEKPKEIKQTISLINVSEIQDLCGARDENLRLLQNHFTAKIIPRGDTIAVHGHPDEVTGIISVLEELIKLVRQGERVTKRDVEYLLAFSRKPLTGFPAAQVFAPITMPLRGKKGVIKPKTFGQRQYLNAIAENDIVFGVGPAGTGKTYLAMAAAVSALERKLVRRIVLARPAVEAGESLGFLPGDLQAKVDPFLRPLYDALYDMLNADLVQRYILQGTVEIAPLAYMRGRTLNDSFVILDEAQNTTSEQMKMFLTRLGFDSKAIITGDITQIDLPSGRKSGLIEVCTLLNDIDGISFVYLGRHDIVRHPLVQKIVAAYETNGKQQSPANAFNRNGENGKPPIPENRGFSNRHDQ